MSCINNSEESNHDEPISDEWSNYKEEYANGRIKATGFSYNNMRVGEWNYFEKNGDLKANGSYHEGLKNGMWYYGQNKDDSIDWIITENKSKKYKLNMPSDWSVFEIYKETDISAYFSKKQTSNFKPNVNIQIVDYPNNFNIDTEIRELSMDYDDRSEINSLAINGLKGNYLYYTANNGNITIKGFQVALKNKKQLVIISCFDLETQFENSKNLFTEIAYSINFK